MLEKYFCAIKIMNTKKKLKMEQGREENGDAKMSHSHDILANSPPRVLK